MRRPGKFGQALPVIFIALGGMLAGTTAQAQIIEMYPQSPLELTANYNTIQVKMNFTGDENGDAQVEVKYWKTSDGPTKADDGHLLVLDAARSRYCGTIFWLQEGTEYTVQVHANDQDGATPEYLTGTITTKTTPATPNPATSLKVYVATNGVDNATCGASGTPCATIQYAHDNRLQPGGQIVMKAGTYLQKPILTKNGTLASPYSIVKQNPADSVIIDGSNVPLQNATAWTRLGGNNSTLWRATYALTYHSADDSLRVVCAGWSLRLHKRNSLGMLTTTPTGYPVPGFYYNRDSSFLYIRLENAGQKPNKSGLTMHVANIQSGLTVFGTNWFVDGISVQFQNMFGVMLGLGSTFPASGSVVRNVRTTTNGGCGIFGNNETNEVLVENCTMLDPRIDSWGYDPCKGHLEELSGLLFWGRGWVVRNNVVRGTFDGIQTTGNICSPVYGSDSDVHNNLVDGVADDGLEFDGSCAISLAAWRNTVTRAIHGFSPNPLYVGPMYMLYNVLANCDDAGIKDGAAGTGGCYPTVSPAVQFYYHNTLTTTGYSWAMRGVGGSFSNKHFRNNILLGSRPVSPGPGQWYGIAYDNFDAGIPCSFDHDLLFLRNTPPGTEFFFDWTTWTHVSCSTLAELQDSTGFELNGVVGEPLYVNAAAGDYHLQATSPGIDIGTLIPGINTPYWTVGQSLRYAGAAPDAGAYEYGYSGGPLRAVAVAPEKPSLTFARLSSNPANGPVRFALTLGQATPVELVAYDILGRRVKQFHDGPLAAGDHPITWDGTSDAGTRLPPGVYMVRLRWAGGIERMRVVLLH